MDVIALLQRQAQTNPAKPAIIFRERTISFLQLKDMAFRLANSLIAQGIKKGDRVGIYLPNLPEYLLGYLSVWCAGATCVPLDYMLTEDELISCLLHSQARFLIMRTRASISVEKLAGALPSLEKIILCQEAREGFLSLERLLQDGGDAAPERKADERDQAIIFYTSGTTGAPKGVLVNYRQLDAPAKGMEFFVGNDIRDDDSTLCALPFSHLGGLIYLQVIITFGVTMVLMERFHPLEFLKNIERYRIGWFWLVPSMYYAILQLKEFESFDLSGLRWLVCFGASSSADALRRFHRFCPRAHFYNGWGMTETNAPTCVLQRGSQKIESIGRPAPWVELKLFNELDEEVPAGSIGEIVVRGWVVTDGYYRDPALTAEVMRGGWFHTGDLGRFDAEGDLYIAGRKKEMIKVGGEIVFEPEVEAVIHRHPEVAEAAVVGVPDALRGEVPKAYVVLKSGSSVNEEELRYFLRQHLAHFKIPHQFEFSPSLPKNRAGKVDKDKLRQGK